MEERRRNRERSPFEAMNSATKSELKQIEMLARAENYHEALSRADALVAEQPTEADAWATRAYVQGRQGDILAAISDMDRCLELRRQEPNDFFTRGRLLFRAGRFKDAILDFSRVIQLCEHYNSNYYRQAAYCFRADAYLRVGQYREAQMDCRLVFDKEPFWTDKLRTIDEILDECQRNIT